MPELLTPALPTARDWMQSSPFTLSPEEALFDAIDKLVEHGLAAAPVVGRDDALLGMLTEKDCLRVLSNVTYDQDLGGGTVGDYQSAIRVTVEPGMDLFRTAELFLATNFPVLPVAEGGRLVGLISRFDMLRGIQAFRAELARTNRRREEAAGHQADRPRGIESMQRAASANSPEQLARLFGRKT